VRRHSLRSPYGSFTTGNDRAAIVTGASSGIGEQFAQILSRRGYPKQRMAPPKRHVNYDIDSGTRVPAPDQARFGGMRNMTQVGPAGSRPRTSPQPI
jgi:hypothetical protein